MDKETMDGGEGSSARTRPSSSVSRIPGCPSPFLTRLYAMVNDLTTNALISWGSSGTSIIIWDHLTLEADLLPRFFKHSNLSSFVYQLNTYGFRKIGMVHQWEYENPYFQAGRESWLANIERRNQSRKRTTHDSNTSNDELETELEILKNEIKESKLEIENLKKKQAEMEIQIEEIKITTQSEKLTMLLAKACREIHVEETSKKRNLGDPEILTENEEMNAGTENLNQSVDQNEEDNCFNLNSEPMEKKESADYAYWEQMMKDDDNCEVCDNGEWIIGKRKEQAEIAAELEGLIANLPNQDTKPVITLESFELLPYLGTGTENYVAGGKGKREKDKWKPKVGKG